MHNPQDKAQGAQRPLILISNDDGVDAPGLRHLAELAQRHGDVIVVAPDGPRSGMSSALTVNTALRLTPQAPIGQATVYSTNGTPVDCVNLACHAVLDREPTLMLSGINHGSNAAVNNIYSGTMGAAMEACINGIPAVGLSLLDHSHKADFSKISQLVDQIITTALANPLPDGICLNVNFPAQVEPLGVKVVRAAKGYWTDQYQDYTDPHGVPFYWLTGKFHNIEPDNPETDEYWLHRDWATIVPIRPDQTANDQIVAMKGIF